MSRPMFADGSWVAMSQTVTRKGEEVEVPVRLVAYAPPTEDKKTGKTFFPKLGKNSFWQVIVSHTRGGEPVKVKLGLKGIRVTHSIQHKVSQWWEPARYVSEPTSTGWMSLEAGEEYCRKMFQSQAMACFVVRLLIDAQSGNEAAQKMPA